jgi:hypothetical protein
VSPAPRMYWACSRHSFKFKDELKGERGVRRGKKKRWRKTRMNLC